MKASKRAFEEINVEDVPQPRKKAKLGDGLKWHETLKVWSLLKIPFKWVAQPSEGTLMYQCLGWSDQ